MAQTRSRGARPHTVLVALALAAPSLAAAQTTGAPDAGSILQEVRPVTPAPPSSVDPGLTIEQDPARANSDNTPIAITTINIVGATLIDSTTLHAVVADAEGRSLTFSQLGALADRITEYYRAEGYTLAKAIIPPQEIRGGVVTIEVVEARYGAVTLENRSRVSDGLLRDTLSPLRNGDAIHQSALDRSLLLASDVPGVIVGATLRPGARVGGSDLAVDIAAGPAITGNAMIDTYGNGYTGRARLSGTVNFINPLHHGDVLSISGLTSGEGLNYARVGYTMVLNGAGDRAGVSYSALQYVLGDSLAPLEAHGEARVASVWASHPFVRSRNVNMYGHIQYDRLDLQDRIDIAGIQTDRTLDDWTIGLDGDVRDRLFSGGITTWSLGWTHGSVSFDDTVAAAVDAATARTAGEFSKWSVSLSRLQRLSPEGELYLSATGQWTDSNLDSAEKMVAGGPYSVRAYDVGAMSGDTVYRGTVELRHALGEWNGAWQVATFVDSARLIVNERPWAAGPNTATLTGAGIGLNWFESHGVTFRAYVAARVGEAPEQLPDAASARAGIAISMGF